MKLTTLHENAEGTLDRLFIDMKKIKRDLTWDDVAWFIAYQDGEGYSSGSSKDMAYLFYEGVTAYKGNKEAMQEWVDTYTEDYPEEGYNRILSAWQSFIKPR